MPVHALSIISPTIQTFDSVLYDALTTRENYCYITSNASILPGDEIITYKPEFQLLNTAIVSYITINRNELVSDLFSTCTAYMMLNSLHATDFSQAANSIASSLFSMDGQIDIIKNSTISYYADYNGTLFTNLTSLTTAIGTAHATEESYILYTLQLAMTTVIKNKINQLLVETIVPSGVAATKEELGLWFYGSGAGELGFKAMNIAWNFGLTPPAYVP